jgi:hypothetical protein
MNERGFDRIAEAYLADGPTVLADRVLDAALDEVHLTRQRHVLVRVPWRFPNMNTFSKVAVAAVAVIAVGFVGLTFLGSGGTGVGGAPSASPSPTLTPAPSASPIADQTAPPLTGQFTSASHGFSIAYPETWSTRPATAPWISGFVDFSQESGDILYHPELEGNLWLAVASQPLGDRTPAEFEADVWQMLVADDPASDCAATAQPTTIDGAAGVICPQVALVTKDGRGYFIVLYTSGDEAWIGDVHDDAWFASVLATMKLDPASAVDTAP